MIRSRRNSPHVAVGPRPVRRPVLRGAAACLAVLVVTAGSVPQALATEAAPTPCRLRGLEHEALCGQVMRPLDPAQPQGARIAVHYAVLPAVARNKKPDPVFFFAGGPGQSAMALAPQVAAMLGRFSNRRDVVLIDQRGTGRSAPLVCDEDDPALPLAQVVDPQRQRTQLAACRDQLKKLPHGDLRFYTTPIAMADADAVRAALGAERINVIGGSYGTRAVIEYQRQFPQRVRRAVIDGVAPPDMRLHTTFAPDAQAAFDALLDACGADAACAVRHPNLRARWRDFVAAMPREMTLAHPLTGRHERLVVTPTVLASMLRGPLYVPALASALPHAMDAAIDGRLEPLTALTLAFGGRRGSPMSMAMGMHFSVVCTEDLPPHGPSSSASSAAAPAAPDFGATFDDLYRDVCAAWPRGNVPSEFYRVVPAGAPTLVLSGGLDPVTPPRHGARVATALGAKARHVVVPNAGHGVIGIGCMRDVVYRFIDTDDDTQALQVDADCATRIPRPPMFEPPSPAASTAAVKGTRG